MADLQFSNDQEKTIFNSRFQKIHQTPFPIRILMDYGIAKDEKRARNIILIVVALIVLVAIFLIYRSTLPPTLKTIPFY